MAAAQGPPHGCTDGRGVDQDPAFNRRNSVAHYNTENPEDIMLSEISQIGKEKSRLIPLL